MPIITVYPDVVRAYNRVEIDWSDSPNVDWAKVTRVDAVTGECTPLRPYICFFGDYLNVSCDGHGIFWDTEVPLDRSVYYITEALAGEVCLPEDGTILDTFSRLAASSWGAPDIGPPYVTSGAAVNVSVNGTNGVHAHPAINAPLINVLDTGQVDNSAVGSIQFSQQPSGAALDASIVGRYTDANNFYSAVLVNFASTVSITLRRRVAGVDTDLATFATSLTSSTNTDYRVRFQWIGTNLAARLWLAGEPEPAGWQVTATDANLTTGTFAGFRSIINLGSTNVLPLFYRFDDFAIGSCEPCIPTTATSEPTTMPSNGAFRLKDPLRPCNDLYIALCFDQQSAPECLPGSGIFFAAMDTETYDANTLLLNPTNAATPIAVTRTRRTRASLMQLVTRTFADRDNLLRINQPGSPLLLQAPPNYGIDQAYISIGEIGIERGLSDHRFPVRINNLPFQTVTRPTGPTQGVCGSRVADSCDIYDTWQEITDAGLTYEDFVRGRAGDVAPGTDIRTWDDVQAEFADWDAVEANGTWAQLEAGE